MSDQDTRRPDAGEAKTDDDDVEGHNFLPLDTGTARQLARARNADIERSLRERRLAKEARPNKRHE